MSVTRGAKSLETSAWMATDLAALDQLWFPTRQRTCSAAHSQTWLILPVVICLSQRLSHACLSISFYTVKLRMAH